MKKLVVLIVSVFACAWLPVKSQFIDSSWNKTVDSLWTNTQQTHKTNMTVLAAWAGVNIIQSAIATTDAKGAGEHFARMNIYWNVVNAGIATAGIFAVKKNIRKKVNAQQLYSHQQHIEKILLLNTGLDVGYVFAGLYLNERGKRLVNEQSQGFGRSLLLQGGFLFVFDIIQYYIHRKQGKIVGNWFKNAQLSVTPNGIGLTYAL